MKRNINKFITVLLCIIFFILFYGETKADIKNIEDLDIYLGVAGSLKKIDNDTVEYIITSVSNKYNDDKTAGTEMKRGIGSTIGYTRIDRQRKISNEFFLGLSQIYLIDKSYAEFGLKSFLDILFKNPVVNDNAFIVLCKENSDQYFKLKIKGYENNSEYIVDMLKNSVSFNFFNHENTIKNAMLDVNSEGKNFVCPYINVEEEKIEIKGIAVFKNDKLVTILNMEESKIMNILRENKGKGIITIQDKPENFINYDAKVKRKVKCEKIKDKYFFVIDLNFNGDILNNSLYKNIIGNNEVITNIENLISEKIKSMCYDFINKMQNQYKVDCLQLGWVAAGKYGRDKGVDWNDVISKSDIKVNVKVKLDKVGRGGF